VGAIFLLGLAAAVYPQLLAVVVLILTRPNPKPLLWACYAGSLSVSVGAGIAILAVFRSRGTIAGTSSHRLGPAAYLALGTIALALAVFIASRRGRDRAGTAARRKSRAELALKDGSLAVGFVVGALLALPGPFDLLALGRLARGDYTAIAAGALIVAFALIKFVLIEIPILGYAVDPDGTTERVARFSGWMHANKLVAMAAAVAVIGLLLIGRGLSALG
jgi:hypothetical protein